MLDHVSEDNKCCVCGKKAAGSYGCYRKGELLFVYVCGKHMLSSEQKCSLLDVPFNDKTNDEVVNMLIGMVRFYNEDSDKSQQQNAC